MKEIQANKVMRCEHCGGPMRLYRDGINCLMCGRALEHRCENCRCPENRTVEDKKVA